MPYYAIKLPEALGLPPLDISEVIPPHSLFPYVHAVTLCERHERGHRSYSVFHSAQGSPLEGLTHVILRAQGHTFSTSYYLFDSEHSGLCLGNSTSPYLQKFASWSRAARGGHVGATYRISLLYLTGTVLPPSRELGLALAKSAAQRGHPKAHYALAQLHLEEKDRVLASNKQALSFALTAAKSGLLPARQLLIDRVNRQTGTVANYDFISEYYRLRLEENGHLKAAFFHGKALYSGDKGALQNRDKGMKLLKKTAEAGFGPAQLFLAQLYLKTPRKAIDHEDAMRYLRLAAQQGTPEAKYTLACLLKKGPSQEARKEAAALFEELFREGDERARIHVVARRLRMGFR